MAFTDITARIVAILRDNLPTLVEGLLDPDILVEGAYPYPHFADQVMFVWRESLPDVSYGNMVGEGASAHGEIDGVANWTLGVYVKVPGNEEAAAEELAKLAWNILTVLRGWYRDDQWQSLMIAGTTATALPGEGGSWYVGENWTLRVRWEMSF